jgi:tRNA(Ser,Leu) C12 N-acetylase TAN1
MAESTGQQGSTAWEWNLLVTAQEGAASELKRLVKRHGVFRSSGFRNVLLGRAEDAHRFLRDLALELERKPFVNAWLGRVLPIQVSWGVRPEGFVADAESRLESLVDGLEGKSFHVRVERRGHKGQLHTVDLERHLGTYLWEQLHRRRSQPVVSFKDPDIIVAIEIVGETAGIAVVSRELRTTFPFVKVD